MDNSNRQNDLLGVNKMGKNIRKSPIHQPNFANAARPQPQPQVYNINKNDFRIIVQQLTGSPSHEPPHRPPQNPPKPPSNRLQRIRPPPLTPINRPPMAIHPPAPVPAPARPPLMAAGPYNNNYVRPLPQYGQPQTSPRMLPPAPNDFRRNTAESPTSLYMRYLQNSIDSGAKQPQPQQQSRPQPQPQPHVQSLFQGSGQNQPQPQAPGLLPNPPVPALPSPRMNGPPPLPSPRGNGPLPPLPPRMHGPPPPLPSPRINGPPPLLPSPTTEFFLPSPTGFLNLLSPRSPSPQINGPPPLLPSPTTEFFLPSPTGFLNLLSPRSSYPLLSPGYQHPPPLSPNFSFSPMPQSGILGPGPQPPPSPGYGFPLSPSGFFPISSPSWRDQ